MVAGVLWALPLLMVPSDETELTGIVGGCVLAALGITRLIRQYCAERRCKCEAGAATNVASPHRRP
jgi:hypothetical protein